MVHIRKWIAARLGLKLNRVMGGVTIGPGDFWQLKYWVEVRSFQWRTALDLDLRDGLLFHIAMSDSAPRAKDVDDLRRLVREIIQQVKDFAVQLQQGQANQDALQV